MIFDCNVQFGFDLASKLPCSIDELINVMDAQKIDCALITNLQCQRGDFNIGNDETLRCVQRHKDRLKGMVGYNETRYFDIDKTTYECLSENEFAGVRIYNTQNGFMSGWGSGINSLVLHSVLKIVAEYKKVVFLEGGYSFSDISMLCEAYPSISFIASGTGYMNLAESILAMKQCSNMHLDISTLDAFEGVSTLCKELGPDRILYGTGWPFASVSCARIMVEKSTLTANEKQMVLGSNLQRILEV